jgi:hypothetical protein
MVSEATLTDHFRRLALHVRRLALLSGQPVLAIIAVILGSRRLALSIRSSGAGGLTVRPAAVPWSSWTKSEGPILPRRTLRSQPTSTSALPMEPTGTAVPMEPTGTSAVPMQRWAIRTPGRSPERIRFGSTTG